MVRKHSLNNLSAACAVLMTLNNSRQQLPSIWDKTFEPDDKGCLQVTGLEIKYVGQCVGLAVLFLVPL